MQAADILRTVGVGRNEYISTMNQCKAKRLMWRVNKSLAKEMLPTEPCDIDMQPWWTVNVVNLGLIAAEFLSYCLFDFLLNTGMAQHTARNFWVSISDTIALHPSSCECAGAQTCTLSVRWVLCLNEP